MGCGQRGARQPDGNPRCPALEAGNPIFVPEPIRGNPLNRDIIFLAANPGGGWSPPDPSELNTCPWWDPDHNAAGATELEDGGTWGAVLATHQSFANHHVHGNEVAVKAEKPWVGYEEDYVTPTALGIIAWIGHTITQPIRVDASSPLWRQYLGGVALVNILHCKSHPGFPSARGTAHVRDDAHRCGRRTWELFEQLRPKMVIAFGKPVRIWYHKHSHLPEPREAQVTVHQWANTERTKFYWVAHPGHRRHAITCREVEELYPRP